MANLLEGMTQTKWDRLTSVQRDAIRDRSGLTPQLDGLEGWRVEVLDAPDDKPRRFIVGKSTGWRPCYLEIHNRRSLGGSPVQAQYHHVRRIEKVR